MSSIDPDSNAILALAQQSEGEEEEEDSSMIDKAESGGAVELFKKDEQDNNELEEEDEDDEEMTEEQQMINNARAIELDLTEFFDETSDKESGIHKVTKSVLNQVCFKYTNMFKRLLCTSNKEKIIYLRDFGEMKDAFTRIMLKSLVAAVEESRQKGNPVMIIASHFHANKNENHYIPAIANMRRISVLPLLENQAQLDEWKSVMKNDEESRISEINAKQLLAMYSQKNPLDLKRSQDLLKDLVGLNNISKSIWSPSDIDRRVTTAIGHALEHNKTDLDLQDFKVAHTIAEQVTHLQENSWKQIKNMSTPIALKKDGSIDMNVLQKSCNEYERKLLGRMVDPCKL